jgi:hypothetical protein
MPIYNELPFFAPQRTVGTKYADGVAFDLRLAMNMAKRHFIDEFGYEPEQNQTVFECYGRKNAWIVTIYEAQSANGSKPI